MASADSIAVIPGTGGSENAAYNYNGNFGWIFTLSSSVTVTGLGYFDANSDGLSDAYPVGIFDTSGNLLTSATVPAGTGGTLLDGFRFVPASLVLGPGTYEIGAYYASIDLDNFLFGESGSVTIPGLTLGSAFTEMGNSLAYTVINAGNPSFATQGYFGPNFTVSSVPEPTTLALAGLGGLAALVVARRRK